MREDEKVSARKKTVGSLTTPPTHYPGKSTSTPYTNFFQLSHTILQQKRKDEKVKILVDRYLLSLAL